MITCFGPQERMRMVVDCLPPNLTLAAFEDWEGNREKLEEELFRLLEERVVRPAPKVGEVFELALHRHNCNPLEIVHFRHPGRVGEWTYEGPVITEYTLKKLMVDRQGVYCASFQEVEALYKERGLELETGQWCLPFNRRYLKPPSANYMIGFGGPGDWLWNEDPKHFRRFPILFPPTNGGTWTPSWGLRANHSYVADMHWVVRAPNEAK